MGQISCRSIMWFDIRVALFLLLFVAPSCSLRWETSKIWPAPQTEIYDTSNPVLRTLNTSNFHFEFDDNTNISNEVQCLIKTAQTRFFDSLRKLVPPDPISNPPDDPNAVYDDIPGVRFQIASDTTKLAYGIDESYIIHIGYAFNTTTSYIHVECITVYGALHALQSLLQIVEFGWIERDENNQDNPIFLISHTPMYIQDAPEYGYRGLMIDTSRHYLDVDLIITNLHVMAAHKLNVMHWHLVDSQSWPYASSQFPELAEKAAYCRHCTYNSTQIKNILQAAASLGIRVIVEIDLPGHSQAIGNSHPEFLTSCFGMLSEPLDVTNNEVLDFVKMLYTEVTQVFPGTWIHVGGDEVELRCWQNSTKIQEYLSARNWTVIDLLDQFEQELLSTVITKLHRRPIVWQELFDSNLSLPSNTIVDVWKNSIAAETLRNATLAGYDAILSACWYLDHLNDDWWKLHSCNPRGFSNLTDAQKKHILGGHASMWGERIDGTNFFPTVWPRASSMAEVLWSGSPSNHTLLKYNDVMDRLSKFRCDLLRRFDIPASPIQPDRCNTNERLETRESLVTQIQ